MAIENVFDSASSVMTVISVHHLRWHLGMGMGQTESGQLRTGCEAALRRRGGAPWLISPMSSGTASSSCSHCWAYRGCGVLLYTQSVHKIEAGHKGPVGTTGHIWDEDLTELNTPMPRWWMWLFYITIVFGLGYLVLYPGLGSLCRQAGLGLDRPVQGRTGEGRHDYGPLFAKYRSQDLKAVAADPQAHAIGERLFLTYCAQCHGSDARGNKGFPNLTDKDWLYGGDPIGDQDHHHARPQRRDAAHGRGAWFGQGYRERGALCPEPVRRHRRSDQDRVRQAEVRAPAWPATLQRAPATRRWVRRT
jgi:mono/diheme cytochrome c family protein